MWVKHPDCGRFFPIKNCGSPHQTVKPRPLELGPQLQHFALRSLVLDTPNYQQLPTIHGTSTNQPSNQQNHLMAVVAAVVPGLIQEDWDATVLCQNFGELLPAEDVHNIRGSLMATR